MLPNRARYLRSIAGELTSQADRVRDLIGSSHWLSDGHHKEYLLLDVLARHLPNGVVASRGFVIHPSRMDIVSKEQDVLILDTNVEAPLFCQGGLVVATPRSVLAAISVKTTLDADKLQDSVANLLSLRSVLALSSLENPSFWCASYFFRLGKHLEPDHSKVLDWLDKALDQSPVHTHVFGWPGPDLIASAQEIAVIVNPPEQAESTTHHVLGFDIDGTVVLLAHLLTYIALKRSGEPATFGELAGLDEGQPFEHQPSREITWPRRPESPTFRQT